MRILLIFGTRPEAIKMCPLVAELRGRDWAQPQVCVTGQHRQMLDGALAAFGVVPDFDLGIMRAGQTPAQVTSRILSAIQPVLDEARPQLVLVHGDTTTALAAAMACFYRRIPVGHVEAGLRTYDMNAPFPEEMNRRVISLMAKYHFAPTTSAEQNLIREGIAGDSIFVTGNTVIDALKTTVRKDYSHPILSWACGSRLVLITAHRREMLGKPMRTVFRSIRRVIEERRELKAVFPIHLNPEVRRLAAEELSGCERIRIIEPLGVIDFHNFLARSDLVITDSGGIQEEAPFLGVPVLVTRNCTERQEGVDAGALRLIGTTESSIYQGLSEVLDSRVEYEKMARAESPYGDGSAAERIANIIYSVSASGFE